MNNVCHFDLPARDPKKLAEFYGKLFGWKFEQHSGYLMFNAEKGIGGGLEKNLRTTVIYLEVDDIEATLTRVHEAGGKTALPKTATSEGNGHYALFSDVEGTLVGIWSKH